MIDTWLGRFPIGGGLKPAAAQINRGNPPGRAQLLWRQLPTEQGAQRHHIGPEQHQDIGRAQPTPDNELEEAAPLTKVRNLFGTAEHSSAEICWDEPAAAPEIIWDEPAAAGEIFWDEPAAAGLRGNHGTIG